MEKSDLDRLLERYVLHEVSEDERAKIEAWLDALDSGDNTDLELSREEEDRIFQKLTSSVTSLEEIAALKPAGRPRPDKWIMRVAASLLVLTIISYLVWHLTSSPGRQLEVVKTNDVEKVILNDGSLVWLKGESSVLYYEKPDATTRYAAFEGEALFEVSKDADRPFIVQCGDARIKVLGTSFGVRATRGIVEVTVLTGKVNLSFPTDTVGIDLLPQEKAVYRLDGTYEKNETDPQEIAAIAGSTGYFMQFDNTNMREVFRRLESKFNVVIKPADPTIRNCRITIDLTDKSLDHSLRLIAEVLNFSYSFEGNTIAVTGSGCD